MNIKSLLLGSAAALAAVSGAHAADAIVAAEPEALEYVRVCDAFGTGYFYIPGTETCLKIGGYVRTQIKYDEDAFGAKDRFNDDKQYGDYDAQTKGYLTIEAKSDTEFGALTGYINLEANDTKDTLLDGAWINIAGFDVGYFYNWWDDGIAGETDSIGSEETLQNSIRYTYEGGPVILGVAVEELASTNVKSNDDVGVSGKLGYTLGGVSANLIGSYDFNVDEAAFRAIVTADVGPGSLAVAGIYATDPSYYWSKSEWAVAASYAIKATDKLTITPGAQYFGNVKFNSNIDAWKAGVTAQYQITTGLKTLATVNYYDENNDAGPDSEKWTGFLRLQRDF
ncbi:porin [Rhizobium sp. DKSPLA3]|uniref:Porin n=1 Tax=Rhizobium quercicola TaxID=2901226 RepID=A0A9X1NTH4_9HYPH|nr:porin [Rhizobium quercicola]MCD7109071.1 porin [Rhizobium quercicola]